MPSPPTCSGWGARVPDGPGLPTRLKVWPQYALPHHGLTRLANAASNSRALARPMIAAFRRFYPVRMDECRVPADGFATLDAFFTRALLPGARRFPDDPDTIVCPCDGRISQLGAIDSGRILQAKGRQFTAAELLADADQAESFRAGRFITLYLAPHDYHRVHVPVTGGLVSETRVPGRLFSVSTTTSSVVDQLYARNERMAAIFETRFGPVAVVMVAAMLVAGIESAWDPSGTRRSGRKIVRRSFDAPRSLERGAELGRFHWGSTVIVLLPPGAPAWSASLAPGQRARLGQALSD